MHIRAARALAMSFIPLLTPALPAQPHDLASIVRDLDTENLSRYEHVVSFSDVEHYAVFRGKDEVHPAAEMTVKMTYKKGEGKSYQILSESGSDLVLKFGLHPLLDNEKAINDPAKMSQSWFTSANYDMVLKSSNPETIGGRQCWAVAIKPRHKAPNMIDGTLWVDARDHSLVQVEGVGSKSPSPFAGTTHMMRGYVNMQGYAMATHARAESGSLFFGRTLLLIDYSDYQFTIER